MNSVAIGSAFRFRRYEKHCTESIT